MIHLLATTAQAPTGASRSLIDYIVQSGWVGAIILVVSLFATGLVVAQLLRVRRSYLAPPAQVEAIDEMLRAGRVDQAREWCLHPDNASFLTRVFGSALVRCRRSAFGLLELRTALEEGGQVELARLQRPTDGVHLVAQVAPMLGLLGTVVGMVGAFDAISIAELAQDSGLLAGYISQALVTTVLGLIVAIPTTAAYTYLRNRADTLATEIAGIIEDLAAHLESGSEGAAAQPTPPPPAGGAPRPTPRPAPQAVAPAASPRPNPNPGPGAGA